MSHTPFIVAAYAATAVVLLWAAFSPVLQRRALMRELKARKQLMDKKA